MATISASVLARASEFFSRTVLPWWQEVYCRLGYKQHGVDLLLAGIYLQLQQLTDTSGFGSNYYRIDPYTLTAAELKMVLDTEQQGRMRKVMIWVDQVVGGPLPTVRVNTSATNSQGVAINPGMMNDMGEVAPDVKLYLSSDQAVTVYVVSRA